MIRVITLIIILIIMNPFLIISCSYYHCFFIIDVYFYVMSDCHENDKFSIIPSSTHMTVESCCLLVVSNHHCCPKETNAIDVSIVHLGSTSIIAVSNCNSCQH